eukprot:5835877-Alexandrium_andersonii.AAC.1
MPDVSTNGLAPSSVMASPFRSFAFHTELLLGLRQDLGRGGAIILVFIWCICIAPLRTAAAL